MVLGTLLLPKKSISSDAFGVPVLIAKFVVLDWSVLKIHSVDINTRKILSMCVNFSRNNEEILKVTEGRNQNRRISNTVWYHSGRTCYTSTLGKMKGEDSDFVRFGNELLKNNSIWWSPKLFQNSCSLLPERKHGWIALIAQENGNACVFRKLERKKYRI